MATDKISAGLMMFRRKTGELEIFLAHPGGPYLKNKDLGYWGIPRGRLRPARICWRLPSASLPRRRA